MAQMKQPIHYANVKHRTCSTAKGQRRSPVIGPAYESNMPLLDRTTGRMLYRKHTDGTDVIYNEIFSADPNCKYGHKSVSVQSRRTELWNDLYAENKNDKEKIAAYGEIAIPNNISNEEMIELAQRLGNYFSTTFKRPVDLSIHKKPGNNHIHFSLPEREYKNGKWMQKRKKIFKDMNGNLIYNKIYKDERGWDIRRPQIDEALVPDGADPYERNPINGNYLYQKLEERNKKKWDNDTRTGKFLEPEELSKMHNDIDDVVNIFLHEQGYNVTVKRNRPEIKKILNEHKIKQIRIPTTDYKMHSPVVEEIRKKNERNKMLTRALEYNFNKEEKAEFARQLAEQEELNADMLVAFEKEERQAEETNLAKAKKEYQDAVKDYVENELHPEEVYIADYMQPYRQAVNFKKKQCDAASKVLTEGIDAFNQDITKLAESENRSVREEARLELLKKNKTSWESSLESVTQIQNLNNENKIRAVLHNQWNGLAGWKRVAYIYNHVSKDAGLLYRDYLITKNEIQPEKNPDLSIPKNITLDDALTSIINGKSTPNIKSKFDNTITATQNIQIAADAVLARWQQNTKTELHTPPEPSDFEFLTAAATAPVRIQQINENKTEYNIYKAVPKNYNPAQDYQEYQANIKNIEDASPYNIESKRLNQIQIQNLERLIDKIITPTAKKIFKQRQEERTKATFLGKVVPAPNLAEIKNELRKKYVDKNNKPTYALVVTTAQRLKLDVSTTIATRDALKANYNNWHNKEGNLLDIPKNRPKAAGQAKTLQEESQKEIPVEIQFPSAKHKPSKLDEIAYEQQTDGSYKTVSETVTDPHLTWKDKDDDHKKSEMELAEEKMSEGWHPNFPPRTR